MRLIEDYAHAFRGPSGVRSACRVSIYRPDEEGEALDDASVVISELPPATPAPPSPTPLEQIAAEVMDAHGLESVPVFIEHYPPEATGGRDETFDLVVFAHHEVREIMRGGVWRKEVGPPTWKPLGRRAVEVLVGTTV